MIFSVSTDNTNLGLDNSRYHAQPHPIIVKHKLRFRQCFSILIKELDSRETAMLRRRGGGGGERVKDVDLISTEVNWPR